MNGSVYQARVFEFVTGRITFYHVHKTNNFQLGLKFLVNLTITNPRNLFCVRPCKNVLCGDSSIMLHSKLLIAVQQSSSG